MKNAINWKVMSIIGVMSISVISVLTFVSFMERHSQRKREQGSIDAHAPRAGAVAS
jgi:hypothetical protein